MVSVSSWLFCVHIICIKNAIGVKIFENIRPPGMPKRHVEFEADVSSKTCLLKPDGGPCRGNIKMYYFDYESKSCSSFSWGGCQGNGNRFDTETDCMETCLSKENGPKRRPRWCNLSFDYGYCFGSVPRYYYDYLWKVCKQALYSGCGGNKNNFYSLAQCESVCLFRNGPIQDNNRVVTQKGLKKVMIINPEVTGGAVTRGDRT